MSYKINKSDVAKLDNRKMFPPSSLEYEKSVHSVLVQQDNNMQEQQNFSYGNPNQNDIYQYRYDSFTTGSRDVDVYPVPYASINLPKTKKDPVVEFRDVYSTPEVSDVCGVEEDGVTSVCGRGAKHLYKIMDPKFNLREAAKNCILLEDHLSHVGKQCSDCIKKHCLMIEGFLEEGITLDKKREHKKEFDDAIKDFRVIFQRLADKLKTDELNEEDCLEVAQEIRKLRKPLCQKYATFF